MEPTNHPFRKENDLNQTSMIMLHVNLQERNWEPFKDRMGQEYDNLYSITIFESMVAW